MARLAETYVEITFIAQSEPSVITMCFSRHDDDPNLVHVFQRYKDQKAFEETLPATGHSEGVGGTAPCSRELQVCKADSSTPVNNRNATEGIKPIFNYKREQTFL